MRFLLIISSLILVGVIGAAIAWFARGIWDEAFMMENRFHIANHSDKEIDVEIQFPSGAKFNSKLQAWGSQDFKVDSTGEGALKVLVNGKVVGDVGYVTSMNAIVVLSVDESKVGFSQIFPRPKTEQMRTESTP